MKPPRPPAPPASSGPPPAATLLAMAVQLLQAGRASEARARCLQALQINHSNADAHFLLGAIAAQSGEFTQAVDHFGATVQLRPAHAAAWSNRGVALRKLGRHEEASACFRE